MPLPLIQVADSKCHKIQLCPEPVLLYGKIHRGYHIEGCLFKEGEKDICKEALL